MKRILWAIAATGTTLSIFGLLAGIMLVGVVVNAAILLIDEWRRTGGGRGESEVQTDSDELCGGSFRYASDGLRRWTRQRTAAVNGHRFCRRITRLLACLAVLHPRPLPTAHAQRSWSSSLVCRTDFHHEMPNTTFQTEHWPLSMRTRSFSQSKMGKLRTCCVFSGKRQSWGGGGVELARPFCYNPNRLR